MSKTKIISQETQYELASLKYNAELGTLYHESRARFFAAWHSFAETIIMMFGSVAFITLFYPINSSPGTIAFNFQTIFAVTGGIVTLATLLDRGFKLSQKEFRHNSTAKDYFRLILEIDKGLTDPAEIKELHVELHRIAVMAEEMSASKLALEALAHNRIVTRYNLGEDKLIKVGFWQSAFSEFFTFQSGKLRDNRPVPIDQDNEAFTAKLLSSY